MCYEDIRYYHAARSAAEILNLHFDSGKPKSETFRDVLFVILAAINAAQDEINVLRNIPSEN
jgi:hypothetical protein